MFYVKEFWLLGLYINPYRVFSVLSPIMCDDWQVQKFLYVEKTNLFKRKENFNLIDYEFLHLVKFFRVRHDKVLMYFYINEDFKEHQTFNIRVKDQCLFEYGFFGNQKYVISDS